jgi:tetratricopeptide (TPR) repeat protein
VHRVLFVLLCLALVASSAAAQVLVSGTTLGPESDLSPEQEQRLLGEYWTIAKRYKTDPIKTVGELGAWTRDRLGKVQSIQFQPAKPLPEFVRSQAEWAPETLRLAAMLHSDLALVAYQKKNIMEFELQQGLADGWFILADNKLSTAGSLRSRWTISIARMLLVGGDAGIAERILNRASERIANDPAILLALGTVKETQGSRIVAEISGGRIDDPALAARPRDAYLTAAQAAFEKVIKLEPNHAEAKLRLAQVLVMKGDDGRAYSLASEVLGNKPAPAMKYLALLVSGGVLERSRQLDAAAKMYLDAILSVPSGQSAYLALASILHRSGQSSEAGSVMERLFSQGAVGTNADPWWTYPLGLDLSMDKQFEEYRNAVRK